MIIRRTPRGAGALVAVAGVVVAGLAPLGGAWPATAHSPAAAASTCVSGAENQRVRVGSSPNADLNAVSASRRDELNQRLAARVRKLPPLERYQLVRPTRDIAVDVYVHVLYWRDAEGTTTGNIPQSRITNQIAALNAAYKGSRITFTLAETQRIWSRTWYEWSADDDDAAAKAYAHQGTAADLNVYIADLDDDLLGYATFPGGTLVRDGLVLDNDTLPGGTTTGYNQGDTAVHETGHWLGLFHTFQDGCSFVNDGIADTPAMADGANIYKCVTADTCTAPGTDPIHNYMGYGSDTCMTEFTKDQGFRMRQNWAAYRAPSRT